MTLATISETTGSRPMRLRRYERLSFGLDSLLLGASLAICLAFFGNGGAEALIGALAGAVIRMRMARSGERTQAAFSGGFAGLFVGALFAGFFHTAIGAVI
jgi:hypothetical protein